MGLLDKEPIGQEFTRATEGLVGRRLVAETLEGEEVAWLGGKFWTTGEAKPFSAGVSCGTRALSRGTLHRV
jgi:hypothetical protein